LGAERIGHGVRAIEDPALVEYLAGQQIALEVCPTSNLRLGVYPDYEAHPLRRLYEAGGPGTINADDPPLLNTTPKDEGGLLATAFGLSLDEVDAILLNGVRYSFLPADRKATLEAEFVAELARLRADLTP